MSFDENPKEEYSNNENINTPVRSRFSAEEDAKLVELQQQQLDWNEISRQIGNRSPRQCRERFQNYLDPDLNKSTWTPDEDNLLLKKESEMGKKWKKMMPYFQNRSNVNIKNRFTTLQNRKKANERLIKQNETNSEQLNYENARKMQMASIYQQSQQLQQFQQMQSYQQFQQNSMQTMINDQYQTPQVLPQMLLPNSNISPPNYDQRSTFNPGYSQSSLDYFQQIQQNAQFQQQSEQLQRQKTQQAQQLKSEEQIVERQLQQQEESSFKMYETQKQSGKSNKLDLSEQNKRQEENSQTKNPNQKPPPSDKNKNDKIIDEVFDDDQEIQLMWNFLDSDVGQKNNFF
ncbi:hypothetical protein M9Y10_036365 [Tritrichomonas musculus]|uniref:Myb-like DNA-binding domain containing protein n=1 Tax=Tritrichomonas musculus TaxID=1915356 RepID=A0ABR2GWR2_9EUKA